MEWLNGYDLAAQLARKPPSIAESVALIKRVASLQGRIPNPLEKRQERSAEEELADEIARLRGVDPPPTEANGAPR